MTPSSSDVTAAPQSQAGPQSQAAPGSAPQSALPFTSALETAASWLNEPAGWRFTDGALVVDVGPRTGFWRETHHGSVRDDGHLLGVLEPGDFVAVVEVEAHCRDRHDQAGIMVRQDAEHWLTAGVELDGAMQLSAVVTHVRSDRSLSPLAAEHGRLGVRVARTGDAVTVEFAPGGLDADVVTWQPHRMAWFGAGVPLLVGPMAAAPDGEGFTATFRHWEIRR